MSGNFAVNWPALPSVLPRAIMEDDDARLEVIQGLQVVAHTLNNPKDQLFPD